MTMWTMLLAMNTSTADTTIGIQRCAMNMAAPFPQGPGLRSIAPVNARESRRIPGFVLQRIRNTARFDLSIRPGNLVCPRLMLEAACECPYHSRANPKGKKPMKQIRAVCLLSACAFLVGACALQPAD